MKLLFALLFSILVFPEPINEKIFWQEGHKLKWEDFKGKAIKSSNFVASTNTGISFQYSYAIKNNKLNVDYTVSCFFKPEGSWYKAERVNDHILKHEQAHFDISELHARMLRKKLSERKFTKNIKSEIEAIYKLVEAKRRAMQNKFDAESDHSRNVKNEATWQKYIAQQLAEYESWK